jgi:hypothetical protein
MEKAASNFILFTHAPEWMASKTDQFFLVEDSKILGAMSFGSFVVRVEEPMLHYVLHRLNTHYGSLLDHIVHGLSRQLLVLFPQLDN